MNVEHVMTRPVFTCTAESTLNDAARLMWEHDCGALPVVTGPGIVVGMITDRDVCMALYTSGKRIDEVRVGDVMAKDVVTCHHDDALSAVEQRMTSARVRRLPVVDDDGVAVGIVTVNDVARALAGGDARALQETVSTVVAIAAPRHV